MEFTRIAVSVLSGTAGRIVVADLLDRRIFDPRVVREVNAELLAVAESEAKLKLVLDFSRVHYLSSEALNRLIELKDQITASGGALRLCGLRPQLAEIFEITRLDRQFDIAPDQSAALAGF
jgi:anti-sigma B factor antagonist